jgi:PAT family beta-lactamase induction signal transducer AmpG
MVAFVQAFRSKRVALCIAIGFASGLPLYMRGSTLTIWMRNVGIDLKAITLFTLIGFIYTFKFLWAPVIDRYQPPWLGRRRGWMFGLQLALIAGIASLGFVGASQVGMAIVVLAALVTLLSATYDIAADAYRADLLRPHERASGSALYTLGYRGAALTAGALALILSDHLPWPVVFWIMAALMAVGFIPSLFGPEPEAVPAPRSLQAAVVEPLKDFFGRPGAVAAIAFIMLYKVGDYISTEVANLFLVDLKFTNTEIGSINKTVSMVATILGVMLGGGLVPKLGVRRSLFIFGVLQAVTNSGYLVLALVGKNMVLLGLAVGIDWFCGGLGAAAFAAYQLSLCNRRFSATQFAIIASAATVLGRLFTGISGFIIEWVGWAQFFVLTMVVAIPGVLLAAFGPIERAAAPAEPPPEKPAAGG